MKLTTSEWQLQNREVLWKGSRTQNCELMNKNITLDPLDKELEKRGQRFARYADDFTILVNTPCVGEQVLRNISRFLSYRFKLIVNTVKSHVVKVSESKFLGFTFKTGRI